LSEQDRANYVAQRLLLAQAHALHAASAARSESEQEFARSLAEIAGALKALAALVCRERSDRSKNTPGESP